MMTLRQYKRWLRQNRLWVKIWEGSDSENWDATWWICEWSDGWSEQIETSCDVKYDGLAYCRRLAARTAYMKRAKHDGIELAEDEE